VSLSTVYRLARVTDGNYKNNCTLVTQSLLRTKLGDTLSRNRRHKPKFDTTFRCQFFRADSRLLTSSKNSQWR